MTVVDESNNRMRIICPIAEEKDVKKEHLKKCMEANFHTVLDVKYAIYEGYMWSIFVHPLKELSEDQVADAMSQVKTAAATYGSTYQSSNLIFGGK